MTDIKALVARLEACVSRNDVSPYAWARISEAAAALRDLTEWRDIATAPRDGTPILVMVEYNIGDDEWVVDQWVDCRSSERRWPVFQSRIDIPLPPTHWLPLPSAPDLKETGE